jgi:hypothetical protein
MHGSWYGLFAVEIIRCATLNDSASRCYFFYHDSFGDATAFDLS